MNNTSTSAAPKKSKLWIIIVVVLVVLLAIGAGVFFWLRNRSTNSGISVLSQITANADCMKKYNDQDLCKFFTSWQNEKYYTFSATNTDKDGKVTQYVLKSAGKDNTQMTSSEAGKENFNVITIADATYTKDYTDNQWWKTVSKKDDATVKSETENELDFTSTTAAEDKTTYKKIGTEACAKLTCFKYQVIDPAVTDSTEYIYFDNKDYKLRKTRSEYKDGTISESTVDYSKVTITAPTPVKEGSPFQGSITPTSIPSTTTPSSSVDIPQDTSVDTSGGTGDVPAEE